MGIDQAQAPKHEQQREQNNGYDDAYGQRMQCPVGLSLVLYQEKQRRSHAGDNAEKYHYDEYFRKHGGTGVETACKYTPGIAGVIFARAFRVGSYEVRVAALPAIAALLMLALLLSAGFWQLRRADEKRAMDVAQAYRSEQPPLRLEPGMLAGLDIERLRYRNAQASGHYRNDRQYLLDNRTHKHVAGYHVLTPLQLQDSDVHVLVNRGWVPVGPDRSRLPDVTTPAQALAPRGMIVAAPAAGLALGASGYDDAAWPRVVQRVELDRIEEQLGGPLLPFVLRLSAADEYGYERDWQTRTGLSPERHLGYAVQWFALAAALVALSIWVAVKRVPEARG